MSDSACMSTCEKGRKFQTALDFLDEMRTRQLRPDLICLNAVMSACGKCKDWISTEPITERPLNACAGRLTAGRMRSSSRSTRSS